MALTYAQYVTLMKTMLVIDSETNTNFVAVLPSMIAYAENRIYGELDLISTIGEGQVAVVPGTRSVTPAASVFIVQSAYIVTPAGAAADAGKRNPLQRVSLEFLNFVWPSAASTGLPTYYAMKTNTSALLAPTPDAAYIFGALGPIRPAALAVGNPTTFLTLNLDTLFVAASMVFGAGWQRDFGSQADDPKLAISWEAQYQTLKAIAMSDELRRKAQSFSWQPFSPAPQAKESRT